MASGGEIGFAHQGLPNLTVMPPVAWGIDRQYDADDSQHPPATPDRGGGAENLPMRPI